jgi:hypothetical protein
VFAEIGVFAVKLDQVRFVVEQIDMAQVFVKFGGLLILFRIINGEVGNNRDDKDIADIVSHIFKLSLIRYLNK